MRSVEERGARGISEISTSGIRRMGVAIAIGAALALLSLSCGGGGGTAFQSRFAAGNAAYEKGSFEEAAKIYEEIAQSGAESAALQYNLGNAEFRSGRIGRAILAYERSLKIDPRDADVRRNLEYVRGLTADRITPASSPLASLGVTYLLDLTSPDQDAALFLAAWLLAGIALALLQILDSALLRRAGLYAAIACAAAALLFGGELGLKAWMAAEDVGAVVLSPEVHVLSGAGEENPTLFTIHEGLRVQVRSRSGDWLQVSLPNGLAGWLPAADVEMV